MNNSQVAHLWANRSRESARGSNFYFEGDTIYSYGPHFPIARMLPSGAVLFTTRNYSNSTARHKRLVRMAISERSEVYRVQDPSLPLKDKRHLEHYKSLIKRLRECLALARTEKGKAQEADALLSAINEANRFCVLAGRKPRFKLPSAEDQKRFEAIILKRRKEQRELERQLEEATRLQRETARNEWVLGIRKLMPHSAAEPVLLRRSGDYLETSKGAMVPMGEAEKAFRFVTSKRQSGWHRNGETFGVGDFQIDAVNSAGIVAGCHRISWEEIERFAASEGWQ